MMRCFFRVVILVATTWEDALVTVWSFAFPVVLSPNYLGVVAMPSARCGRAGEDLKAQSVKKSGDHT